MKQRSVKILSLLLAALLAAGLAGCGESQIQNTDGDGGSPVTSPAEPSAVAETVPETEETVIGDSVPALDFGGVTVTMAGQGTGDAGNNNLDMTVEEMTGDVVIDAIYQRGVTMEERFNVQLAEPLMADYTTISNAVKAMVRAGDSSYDFVVNQLAQTSADVVGGQSMNMNEIPYLDFDMRWYPANVKESASLNGKIFLMVSDLCLSYVGQTWSMGFNKDLTTDFGITGLYDLAREGEWTLDKLQSITSGLYLDVNGDGAEDAGDCFGFTMGGGISGCLGAAFLYGAGLRYVKVNEDFTIEHLLDSEFAQTVCQKFYDLNNQQGSSAFQRGIDAIMNRTAVFTPAQLGHYYVFARDFDGTFGVLPMPKFNAEQERYATLCDAGCNCISVPITCRDPELTGALIEAMSAYSANNVNPAYVDVALQTKVARDEESAEMMQIVLESRVMDFGYLYCGWNGWTWTLASLFQDPGTYASVLQKNLKMLNKTYEKIVKEFMD